MGKPKIYGKIRIPVCRVVFVCLLLFCESCSPEQEELWDVVPPDGTELPEKPTTLDLYKVRIEAEVHGEPQEGEVELWDKDVCTFRLVDQNGLPLSENEFRLEWRIKMTKRSGGVWEKVFCKDTVHTEARIELTPAFFEGNSNSVDNLLKSYIKDSICERPYQEGYVECELKRKRGDNDGGQFVYKLPQAVRTYVLPPVPQIEMEDYFIDFSVPENPWPHVTLKVQATGFERGLIEVTYPDAPNVSLGLFYSGVAMPHYIHDIDIGLLESRYICYVFNKYGGVASKEVGIPSTGLR
ncbi:hypothetical protein [Paraprevotella xylaniphila]|uniref:hypothetical protein n=1 Tax=Paraprevotella xylaniphila TaxID=454155 RepID=UPI0039F60A88